MTRHGQAKLESGALRYGAVVVVVSAAVARLVFGDRVVPLSGSNSIGTVASVLAAVAAFVGFLLTYRPELPSAYGLYVRVRRALTTTAMAFVHGAIGLLLTVVAFYLFQSAFEGVHLDTW